MFIIVKTVVHKKFVSSAVTDHNFLRLFTLFYTGKFMISAEVNYMYELRNHVYKTDAYTNV